MKTRHWLASVPLLLVCSGCSLFFELNANQCQVTADCTNLGPQFADTLCVNQVCVAKSAPGQAGTGGSSAGIAASGASGDSAKSGGGGSEDAGAAGTSGDGGGSSECSTNAECISAHLDQPYICVDGACLALTSTDCPVLLPTTDTLKLLRTPAPIVVGGYANMNNAQDPHDSLAVINWDLAFNEFNDKTLGGIPNKGGGAARPVLALVCQSGAADITPSLQHLTEEVHAPAVLSTLSADKLLGAFNTTQAPAYQAAGGQPVLFLSTGSANLRLANLDDDGLVWHMLGDPRVLAATTVALLNQIIPAVDAARQDSGPLRVTLVYSDDATMTDLFSVLTTPDSNHPETLLSFNGKSAISQLESGEFREVKIESSKVHTTPVVDNAITDLEAHPPHIVLAMATSEFPKTVVPALESYWSMGATTTGLARPFYLASHLIYNTPELPVVAAQFSGINPRLDARWVGVNYAEAQDDHSKQLYDSYEGRLQSSYHGALQTQLDGTENYYDGAYSLLYALSAAYAARATPTGSDVRDGLQERVFSTSSSAQSVDVGPAALGNTVGNLKSLTYQMSLWGTMGAPNFNRTSGTRLSATSAWCIQKPDQGTAWLYQADGLIYDATNQSVTAPSAGVPDCLKAYFKP